MKKIFSILLFLPLFCAAQDSTSKMLLGISFSNDLCYRFSAADESAIGLKEEFDGLETSRYGYTASVYAGYAFRPNLSVQAGLNISSRGYVIDTLPDAPVVNLKFNYRFLEVPVRLEYIFLNDRKLQPVASLGLFGAFLIQQKTSFERPGISEGDSYSDKTSLSQTHLGFTASFGFRRAIDARYSFRFEGIYRQSVTPLSDTPLRRYLNAGGINLSLVRFL